MEISRIHLVVSLGVGLVAVSFASILIRFAQADGVPSLTIAAWRLIFASLILLPYGLATRKDEMRGLSQREWRLLAAAGLFLGLHFAAWIASLGYTSVASSVVLVSMGPAFVALGSWFFLHERPSTLLSAGIVLATVGSLVISWGDLGLGHGQLLGDLLALMGAIMMAGYLMVGREVRARRSLGAYIALVYTITMLLLMGLVLVTRQPLFGFSLEAYGWMLALGLGPQVIGHSTLNWALRYLSATFIAIVILAEPISSGILAFIILGEAITRSTAVGGAMVLVGIYIASRAEPSSVLEPGL